MNELQALQAMGLDFPGPAYLIGAIVFGIFGFAAFKRGRKTERPVLIWTGLALMLYPYAVSQTWLLWGLGVALCAWAYRHWL